MDGRRRGVRQEGGERTVPKKRGGGKWGEHVCVRGEWAEWEIFLRSRGRRQTEGESTGRRQQAEAGARQRQKKHTRD